MIKAIAVDDEPVALDVIKNHAENTTIIQLVATFLSAAEALKYIRKNPVDLVFLDISMPNLSGLEFADIIKHQMQVIFTTAHAEHALKGFDLAATDYLLKPINFSRFVQACLLAESWKKSGNTEDIRQENIFVKDGHSWIQVKLNNLLYIRGEDNYVSLIESNRRTLIRMTMAEIQKKLPAKQFLRIHKSYIISLTKIEKVEKRQVIIEGAEIPMTMISSDALLNIINTY